MVDKTVAEHQRMLRELGWPLDVDGRRGPETHGAIWQFQRMYTHENLRIDGVGDDKTYSAMRHALHNGNHCSPRYTFHEFASHGTAADGWIKGHRALIRGLEKLSDEVGHKVFLLDGYRNPAHNAAVGGASKSQHMLGLAIDPVVKIEKAHVLRVHAFSGIGLDTGTSLVQHMDVDYLGRWPRGGTPDHPIVFNE